MKCASVIIFRVYSLIISMCKVNAILMFAFTQHRHKIGPGFVQLQVTRRNM